MVKPQFTTTLERHRADLPVYALVPSTAVAAFGQATTFVAEVLIDGSPVGRRTIKPWGDGRWFFQLAKAEEAALGVCEGRTVEVTLVAAPAVHPELDAAIAAHGLEARWAELTPADRRLLAEAVFEARTEPTRRRRIERALTTLRRLP